MKLNNGHYIVDTAAAELISASAEQKDGDGYSYNTTKTYTLWRAKSGNYFITMTYVESISGLTRLLGREARKGTTLVSVYTEEDFRSGAARYHISLPECLLVSL